MPSTNFGIRYRLDQRRFLRDFYIAMRGEPLGKRYKSKEFGIKLWKAFRRRSSRTQ